MNARTEASVTPDSGEAPIDGRSARRQRNRDAVLDVVLEMFAEDMMFPSIEQASQRSGLSLRSLYRYFADPGELVEAAIIRSREQAVDLTHIPHIGEGPFDERLHDFISMRLRAYEATGSMYRATIHNAPNHQRVRDELLQTRRMAYEQFALQFGPELAALSPQSRSAALEAGNVLTQLDSIDVLRRVRNLSVAEAETTLGDALVALLARGNVLAELADNERFHCD
jgi:AcrR family transcriptional regulator